MKKFTILLTVLMMNFMYANGYYPSYGPREQWSTTVSTNMGFIIFDDITLNGEPVDSGQEGGRTGTCDSEDCDILGVMYDGQCVGWTYMPIINNGITVVVEMQDGITSGTENYPQYVPGWFDPVVTFNFYDASEGKMYYNVGSIAPADDILVFAGVLDVTGSGTVCSSNGFAYGFGELEYCLNSVNCGQLYDEFGNVNENFDAIGNSTNPECLVDSYSFQYNLASGNNLISMPGYFNDGNSQTLMNALIDDGVQVEFLLGQGLGLFNTEDGWSGNLTTIDAYSGYWLNTESYQWDLEFDEGSINNCGIYPNISNGNNLLSYKWGDGNSETLIALGGEEFATENFNFILGQGLGLFNTADGWSGNLTSMEEGKGYWVNVSSSNIDFKWGFDNCAEPTESSVLAKTESTIPQEYRVNQSTEQAFYLIKELIIDGKYPVAEDLILAYHNNILVGSTNYSELTVLPIMGRDVSEQTIGFIEAGQVPQLKLLKANGELVDLQADLEPFSNLLVSEVQTVTGSTIVIPTEFVLHPAYPNPFNPVTNISYGLPMDTQVTLNIYDVEGRKISTLVQGLRTAGNHTIEWNAEGYPSGVYFVKLDAGDPSENSGQGFTQTQKLMLVK